MPSSSEVLVDRLFGPPILDTPERLHTHESSASLCRTVADHFAGTLPDCDETRQAIHRLREAAMWAQTAAGASP